MKIIRIIFLSLLALALIVVTGIFIFFQTFNTDPYLPQITKKASFVLGRPVSIGHVSLGLSSQGITLDVGPVIIADDTGFTTEPFIKIDRVRISLDLKSLILQRKIHVRNILLQSPQIHFIRSQQGNINVGSIGHASVSVITSEAKQSDNRGQRPINTGPRFAETSSPSIQIQDASISFIDQNQNIPVDIWLTDIYASMDDVSLAKPFQLSFNASLYSNVPNVHLKASLFLDLSKRSVEVNDLTLHMDMSRLNMDQLQYVSPGLSGNPILKDIRGDLQLNLAHIQTGISGDLTANGDIVITGGVIKDFNIVRTVLPYTLGSFGSIGGSIDNLLNGPLKSTLGADDTILKKASAQFSFHDKTVFIDDSLIETNILELTAKGSVDQGLNVDMQTMLHLNNDVSAALVNQLDGLKFLCDDSQRISIEASLRGVYPHLKYKPSKDFRKKSKKAFIAEGGNILNALFR